MSRKSQELREKRARICNEAQLLIPAEGGKLTEEIKRKFDLMMVEADSLKRDIDREEAAEAREQWGALDADLRRTTRPPEAAIGTEDGFSEALNSNSERRYAKAYNNFLRHGLVQTNYERGVSQEDRAILASRERRDMNVATGSAGGDLVPTGFVYQIEDAMKFYGQMLQAGDVFETSTGQPLPWPTSDDTSSSGEQVDENALVSSLDLTVGSLNFGAFKYSTKLVKLSLELAQDSAFNLEDFLAREFGKRIGRILNSKFTTGAGTTEPKGLITAATSGVAAATGSATNTGGNETGATTVGTTDLTELEHSVDVSYRQGASYMMHDSTLKSVKQLLDKYGRPIWKASLAVGAPDTINGYPYWINNDMATMAASAKSVIFGDIKRYKIRRVKNLSILRLSERFAEYGQIAFVGFARYDGNLLDAGTHPVKYLVNHT